MSSTGQYALKDSACYVYCYGHYYLREIPFIRNAKNIEAQHRINAEIRSALYGSYVVSDTTDTLNNSMSGLHDISAQITLNTQKVVSVSVSADICAAYSEYSTEYFNFEAATGNLIHLDSMLNSEGYAYLNKRLNEEKKKEIQDFLETLNDSASKPVDTTREARTRRQDQIELYTKCLEDVIFLRYVDFQIGKGELIFYSWRCSAHYNRAIDDLYEFKIPIKIKDLRKYLTPYGKMILD
jgi:hypothetical protein